MRLVEYSEVNTCINLLKEETFVDSTRVKIAKLKED